MVLLTELLLFSSNKQKGSLWNVRLWNPDSGVEFALLACLHLRHVVTGFRDQLVQP